MSKKKLSREEIILRHARAAGISHEAKATMRMCRDLSQRVPELGPKGISAKDIRDVLRKNELFKESSEGENAPS